MPHPPDRDFIALQDALAGEYSLDRELGRGGMGIVYLAREVRLARAVAIKVLPPALAGRPALRDAFLREARTAAGLTHPNIVPVYRVGERGGYVYTAMAFVEGTTLGERIRSRGPLLPGQAARVLREIAWALAYAHGAGIVHRDVTAENILLERGTERAIVTDFGIASVMQTRALSDDGRVMGNAHYVSPEQASGEPLDARSDLYSLGIVGYYALTGRLPFDGATSAEVVTKQLTATAPSIASVAPAVPPRLASAVERCLHKEPLRRYRSAESFAEAIDLAFEHAKEIPAPLRVWLNESEKEVPARLGFIGIGALSGITLAFAAHQSLFFLIPFVPLFGLSYVPGLFRLRRVIGDGYVVDDLHAAMREHQLARAEELEYARRQSSAWVRRVMRVLFGASLGATALTGALGWELSRMTTQADTFALMQEAQLQLFALGFVSLSLLTLSTVALTGEFVRLRLSGRIASATIAFWKSRWGSRLARLASIGVKPAPRAGIGMPMLTEIALGRATDHLFEALPKGSRRQLAGLPETVRRLEADAGKLRDAIGRLDDQLAAFEVGSGALEDVARTEVANELRATRVIGAQRLAATVAALENIRLDLLRLQMGSAGLESVTASLDAARLIGDQIGDAVIAGQEVERLLRSATPARGTPLPNDDDTPVGGVAALSHG
jgi:eukaryotic-like serine/threonine-protein kinase